MSTQNKYRWIIDSLEQPPYWYFTELSVRIGAILLLSSICIASPNAETSTATFNDNHPDLHPYEHLPAGSLTHTAPLDRHVFMHPSSGLDLEQGLLFRVGQALFEKLWVFAPASTTSSDGLGPLYNARACVQCHLGLGRGHAPNIYENPTVNDSQKAPVSLFLRLSIPPHTQEDYKALESGQIPNIPDPVYGGQLQTFAYPGGFAEAVLQVSYEPVEVELADETVILKKPTYTIANPGYGPFDKNLRYSPRMAPPMIGLGLIEAIKSSDLEALADPDDLDNNGISGRLNLVWDRESNIQKMGRFGWKAGHPTLAQQNSGALHGDIGISSALFPQPHGDCTKRQADCIHQFHGAKSNAFEASKKVTQALLYFTRQISVPARQNSDHPDVIDGKKLFHKAGCQQCHTPKFVTDEHTAEPNLAKQLIWPYSDFLLHDMGTALADNHTEYLAQGSEWRTPPLWGLGAAKYLGVTQAYLHDGRAQSLIEAILWHGGEASEARNKFADMPKEQRAKLLRFLESL